MPEIIWKYYLAKGPEADDVLSRAKQAWDGIKAHRESLMEEYKANGVLPGDLAANAEPDPRAAGFAVLRL